MFPHETIPDGAVFAPHHYTYLLGAALLLVAAVWDNYRCKEPLLTGAGLLAGLFGFLFVWPYYPVAGAALAVGAPTLAVLVMLFGSAGLGIGDVWDEYPLRYRFGAILLTLGGLDDAVEHAFGVTTPLDYLWNAGIRDYVPHVVFIVLIVLTMAALAEWLLGNHS
jgi:hypothetical protein